MAFVLWLAFLIIASIGGSYYCVKIINNFLSKHKFYYENIDEDVSSRTYNISLIETLLIICLVFYLNNSYKIENVIYDSILLIVYNIFSVVSYYFLNLFVKNIYLMLSSKHNKKAQEDWLIKTFKYLLLLCLIVLISCAYCLPAFFYIRLLGENFDLMLTILYLILCALLIITAKQLSYNAIELILRPWADRNTNEYKEKKIFDNSKKIEVLEIPKFDYSNYEVRYSKQISNLLSIVCYEGFWLLQTNELRKYNRTECQVALAEAILLYNIWLDEKHKLKDGEIKELSFNTIQISDTKSYKSNYYIRIEKDDFNMYTEIGYIKLLNYKEIIDGLKYVLKYGSSLVNKREDDKTIDG